MLMVTVTHRRLG